MSVPLPPNAEVLADGAAVARAAAETLVSVCAQAKQDRIAVALSGGSTPKLLYALLAGPEFRERLPWPRIHWFFGDDRVVPWDDPASNVRMAAEAFGADAPIPVENLHRIDPAGGAEAAALAYAKTLAEFSGAARPEPEKPLFDLVLLGLGEDGHTASLFPGTPALSVHDAWTAAVPVPGMAPRVPRVTLTYPGLASSRLVLFLVTGAGKQDPLRRLAAGEDLPARHVTSAGEVRWLLDASAAGR